MIAKTTTNLSTNEETVNTENKTIIVPMDMRQYTLVKLHIDSSAERVLLELQQQAQEESEMVPAPLFVP